MKRILMVVFGIVLATGIASGQSGGTVSVEETLKKMEHDWTDAFQKSDSAALSRILADDWRGQYPWGVRNKAQTLAHLSAGGDKINSIVFGEMAVRVFGDVAIVMGSDDEKSSVGGKDTGGHYTWTDVWVRRNGRWQAVASQMTVAPRE
jgi:ketosteroid isomerase-like protein